MNTLVILFALTGWAGEKPPQAPRPPQAPTARAALALARSTPQAPAKTETGDGYYLRLRARAVAENRLLVVQVGIGYRETPEGSLRMDRGVGWGSTTQPGFVIGVPIDGELYRIDMSVDSTGADIEAAVARFKEQFRRPQAALPVYQPVRASRSC